MIGLNFIWSTDEYSSKDINFVEDSLNVFSKALVSISEDDLFTYQAHQSEDFNILVYGHQSSLFDENFHQILNIIYQEGFKSFFDTDLPYLIIVEDLKSDTFYFLRDHSGLINAFYYQDNKRFVFSSSFKSILDANYSDKNSSNIGIEDFLRYGVIQEPNTLVDDVFVLQKSSMITLNEETISFFQSTPLLEQKSNNLISSIEACKKTFISLIKDDLVNKILILNSPEDYCFYQFLRANDIELKTIELSDILASFHVDELIKISKDLPFPSNENFIAEILKSTGENNYVFATGFFNLLGIGDVFDKAKLIENNRWFISFPPPIKKLYGKFLTIFKPSENSKKIEELLLQDYFELPDYYKLNNALFYDVEINEELNYNYKSKNLVLDIVKTNLAYGKKAYKLSLVSKIIWAEWFTYYSLKFNSYNSYFKSSTPLLNTKVLNLFFNLNDDIREALKKEIYSFSETNDLQVDLTTIFSLKSEAGINLTNQIKFNALKKDSRNFKNKMMSLSLLKNWVEVNNIK